MRPFLHVPSAGLRSMLATCHMACIPTARRITMPMTLLRPLLLLLATTSFLSAQTIVDVWPEGKMPGKGAKEPEAEVKRKDGFQRITNVSRPTQTFFPAPAKDGRPAPVMIVCPGGGYGYVVMDKEGSEIAAWLNSNGFSALVLKYRTPNNREGALQDVQRSISLTRENAAAWNIDPKRVGVIGFSAGGNVAAKASTQFEARSYPVLDAVDQQSCRPDFAVLVYPAYLDDKAGHVSPDLNLKASIPPHAHHSQRGRQDACRGQQDLPYRARRGEDRARVQALPHRRPRLRPALRTRCQDVARGCTEVAATDRRALKQLHPNGRPPESGAHSLTKARPPTPDVQDPASDSAILISENRKQSEKTFHTPLTRGRQRLIRRRAKGQRPQSFI
jgi:hypothetical protein